MWPKQGTWVSHNLPVVQRKEVLGAIEGWTLPEAHQREFILNPYSVTITNFKINNTKMDYIVPVETDLQHKPMHVCLEVSPTVLNGTFPEVSRGLWPYCPSPHA